MSSGVAWSGSGCRSPSISMASPPCSLCLALAFRGVDADLPCLDEELRARAADFGNGLCEVGVQTKPGGSGIGDKGSDAVFEFGVFVEVEHGDGRFRLGFHATRSLVLGPDGLTPVAFRQHIFRRHHPHLR